MNHSEARILILIAVMIGIGPAYAQHSPDQSSASASPPATSATAAGPAATATPATLALQSAATPASPSLKTLKEARLAGYRIQKLRQGATVFCKEETYVGSRFSRNSCISETQLEETLIRAQSQRDVLENLKGMPTNHEVPPGPPPKVKLP